MDDEKLKALWEYAITADIATYDDVLKVFRLYTGSLNEENSLRLEKAAREAVEAEKDTQRLLEKILRGSTGVTTLLVNLSQTSEPAVDSLHTIFTTEYGDEGEEDDSSIEEEVCFPLNLKRK